MVHCRYVGSDESQVGEREFSRIGEIAVFSEALYADAILGGAPFISEDNFKRVDFSAQELAAYGDVEGREDAPASFNQKVELAQQVFRDVRARMLTEGLRIVAEVSDNLGAEIVLEPIQAP